MPRFSRVVELRSRIWTLLRVPSSWADPEKVSGLPGATTSVCAAVGGTIVVGALIETVGAAPSSLTTQKRSPVSRSDYPVGVGGAGPAPSSCPRRHGDLLGPRGAPGADDVGCDPEGVPGRGHRAVRLEVAVVAVQHGHADRVHAHVVGGRAGDGEGPRPAPALEDGPVTSVFGGWSVNPKVSVFLAAFGPVHGPRRGHGARPQRSACGCRRWSAAATSRSTALRCVARFTLNELKLSSSSWSGRPRGTARTGGRRPRGPPGPRCHSAPRRCP